MMSDWESALGAAGTAGGTTGTAFGNDGATCCLSSEVTSAPFNFGVKPSEPEEVASVVTAGFASAGDGFIEIGLRADKITCGAAF